jgi:hypothetical protein
LGQTGKSFADATRDRFPAPGDVKAQRRIEGFTRTMTTAIALETSKGDLPLAVGLGLVLIAIVIAVNALAWTARRAGERLAG